MLGSIESVSRPEHLLIVGVNWIGDAVMSMPAIQAWRRAHPEAHLTVLVKKPLVPLWRMHAAPDAVNTYGDARSDLREAVRTIRRELPQRAVIFPNSFRSALPPFLARVPQRIARRGQWRRALLTDVLPPLESPVHQSLEYYDLLGMPRPPDGAEYPRLQVPVDAKKSAEQWLSGLARPLLGVMPGAARGPAKRWPVERYADLAQRWAHETGGSVVAMGAGSDSLAADSIVGAAQRGLNLAGKTSLAEWAASVEECDAVVCNDSGGMHLAAAFGRPVVAVFGATDPRVTGPLGPRARVVQGEGPRARSISRSDEDAVKRLAAISSARVYEELMQNLAT